jgi:S-adenosylmethionine-diacylglycerol 3-amino-3-carboxypropyl transferase
MKILFQLGHKPNPGNTMTSALTLEQPRKHAQQLLDKAVHKNRRFSIDGMLERLFTKAFNGLVYSQIWEDPVVDMKAMAVEPHHHIVAISSGGCNVLSYLTANPAKITAVDLSPAHVALVKLKIAGLKTLPDWQSFYRFFGEAKSRENYVDYDEFLRDGIDAETRRYWESRLPNGRRRLSRFANNIYRRGLLGRFIGGGHLLSRIVGKDLNRLTLCETLAEQRTYFDTEIAPLFDKPIVKWLTNFRASLFGLGIPPSQYDALSGGKPMAQVLRSRLAKLACDFPMSENYFAWQAFNRGYAPNAAGPLPPYLQAKQFDILRKRVDRVSMLHASLTDTIAAMPPTSAHRFVLLDAQDWMNNEQLNALWTAITASAAPDARVIFRTAGEKTILPGRVADLTLGQWTYLSELSSTLNAQDRSSIYGGFHVYQRCN